MHKITPDSVGIGLRHQHFTEIANRQTDVTRDIEWLEIHSENFFAEGGYAIDILDKVAVHYPLSFHGSGLSLGSAQPLSRKHLAKLKNLITYYQPALVSEHIAWTEINGSHMHDLLPIPYNQESLANICRNIDQTQQYLGRQILVENPSSYLEFKDSVMSESDFMNQVAARTNCGILLDINNIYVSCQNHGWDCQLYLDNIEHAAVQELHLAGHYIRKLADDKEVFIDGHGSDIIAPIWQLYEYYIRYYGMVATLIERDNNIPPLAELLQEAKQAKDIMRKVVA